LQRHLIVFAKAPRLGAVKSRLARDIGALAALRFHEATLAALLAAVAGDRRWRCVLAVTPDRFAREARRTWRRLPRGVAVVPQGEGDLGLRMRRAIDALPPGPAVLVGSDIPELGRREVEAAFASLGRHDVVFGPALDGGFWLVGERRLRRVAGLFRCVRWSSPSTLADVLANLGPGLSHALLAPLSDVDDGAAYRRAMAARRRFLSPAAGGPASLR
jgi:hypothetical protein